MEDMEAQLVPLIPPPAPKLAVGVGESVLKRVPSLEQLAVPSTTLGEGVEEEEGVIIQGVLVLDTVKPWEWVMVGDPVGEAVAVKVVLGDPVLELVMDREPEVEALPLPPLPPETDGVAEVV